MTKQTLEIDEVMSHIEMMLNERPEPIKNMKAIYLFDITDVDDGTYLLSIQNGVAEVSKDADKNKADCNLKMNTESFQKFLSGNLKGTVAFMTGKLKINGDMGKALQLESLLKQYK